MAEASRVCNIDICVTLDGENCRGSMEAAGAVEALSVTSSSSGKGTGQVVVTGGGGIHALWGLVQVPMWWQGQAECTCVVVSGRVRAHCGH